MRMQPQQHLQALEFLFGQRTVPGQLEQATGRPVVVVVAQALSAVSHSIP